MAIKNSEYLEQVRRQYEEYPYPPRDPEDEKKKLDGTLIDFLDQINHYCYRGRQDFDDVRVLVAGGGTGDSTIFLAEQLRHKRAEIVYVDISRASMKVAKDRARVRRLSNVTWVHDSLLELPDLNLGQFDYISCTGVLHHLESPEKGLDALTSVLKGGGAMGLMLYGRYGRTGVYQMQELMRLVNWGEEDMQARVDNTRAMLGELPATNWFKRAEALVPDHTLYGDVGIYDLFLHSQDRAYTVRELHELVQNAGLHFVAYGLRSKMLYRPESYVRNAGLLARLASLDTVTRQAVAELLSGALDRHTFYVSKQPDTVADVDDLENVPFFFLCQADSVRRAIISNPGQSVTISQPDGSKLQLQLRKHSAAIFENLDGRRSLRHLFECVRQSGGQAVTDTELLEDFRPVYRAFNDMDWMLLRHESVPPFRTYEEMQAPISERHRAART